VLETKVPPAPPSLHVTLPERDDGELLMSVTVAVNAIWFPAPTEAGFGETAVVVEWREGGLTVSDDVPEPEACVESPE
jgi:hypothetical protein